MTSVALLSASVIAVNLLAFVEGVDNSYKSLVTIISVVLSTFALVMSLLVTLLRYEWRENNYHNCAMELENLNQKIQIFIEDKKSDSNNSNEDSCSKEDNSSFQKLYADILSRYNLNHTMFDYDYGSLSDSSREISWMCKLWLSMRMYLFDVYIIYWGIAIIPMLIIILMFLNLT